MSTKLSKEILDEQMKPSWFMKESASARPTSNQLSRIKCPVGTVPIRRTTKEDFIRRKLMPPPEDIMVNSFFTDVRCMYFLS